MTLRANWGEEDVEPGRRKEVKYKEDLEKKERVEWHP